MRGSRPRGGWFDTGVREQLMDQSCHGWIIGEKVTERAFPMVDTPSLSRGAMLSVPLYECSSARPRSVAWSPWSIVGMGCPFANDLYGLLFKSVLALISLLQF